MKLSFLLTVDTENGSFDIVNQETGEVKSVEIPKATTKKTTTRKRKKMNQVSLNLFWKRISISSIPQLLS